MRRRAVPSALSSSFNVEIDIPLTSGITINVIDMTSDDSRQGLFSFWYPSLLVCLVSIQGLRRLTPKSSWQVPFLLFHHASIEDDRSIPIQ